MADGLVGKLNEVPFMKTLHTLLAAAIAALSLSVQATYIGVTLSITGLVANACRLITENKVVVIRGSFATPNSQALLEVVSEIQTRWSRLPQLPAMLVIFQPPLCNTKVHP